MRAALLPAASNAARKPVATVVRVMIAAVLVGVKEDMEKQTQQICLEDREGGNERRVINCGGSKRAGLRTQSVRDQKTAGCTGRSIITHTDKN